MTGQKGRKTYPDDPSKKNREVFRDISLYMGILAEHGLVSDIGRVFKEARAHEPMFAAGARGAESMYKKHTGPFRSL